MQSSAENKTRTRSLGIALTLALAAAPLLAQGFDSGSDGSDGALTLTTPGTVDFFALPGLDADDDGVYHFTTVTVDSGVTVEMRSAVEGPVTWLASGAVRIDGTLDLNGENGHDALATRRRSVPGAGGYSGGAGAAFNEAAPPEAGAGPGGGQAPPDTSIASAGGAAGHVDPGFNGPTSGSAYGHPALLPLVGGSGGGGGYDGVSVDNPGYGGGAGGGALLVASSASITVNGTISANGGCTQQLYVAGSGSGGAIRLAAPTLAGTGGLSAGGDFLCFSPIDSSSSNGRIRLEAIQNQFNGAAFPAASVSLPGIVAIPAAELPLRVVAVAGVPVPADPRGSFTPPDVVVNTTGPVIVVVEGRGVPLGTTVNVSMFLENGDVVTVVSTPLAGTVALSTATATVTIPAGFVSFFVEASWGP